MGGSGSGRWYRWDKKDVAEDLLALDVNQLASEGALRVGVNGTLSWTHGFTGKERGSLAFGVTGFDNERVLRLTYRWSEREDVSVAIRLQATRPNFGGVRWWFTCPLIVGNVRCSRRVGKLYLRRYPGCRHCHDLTYRSCQESNTSWMRFLDQLTSAR